MDRGSTRQSVNINIISAGQCNHNIGGRIYVLIILVHVMLHVHVGGGCLEKVIYNVHGIVQHVINVIINYAAMYSVPVDLKSVTDGRT